MTTARTSPNMRSPGVGADALPHTTATTTTPTPTHPTHMRPHTTSKAPSTTHPFNNSHSNTSNNPNNPNLDPNTKNNRRHSLPLHFLPPALWTSNTSSASLLESEEAARGEHILDEAKVAHRLTALRSLNGTNRSQHRYAKSTGETYNQPVIVRTYSGAVRPRSLQRDPIAAKKQNGAAGIGQAKMDLKLPPVEAFSFKGIMDDIKHTVSDDLERIAEICARSKYSLANQHEFHHPPHGTGDRILQPGGASAVDASAPTLQVIAADEDHVRPPARSSRGGRRPKSVAYGTLETIMSSSRSSEEDKSRKKPAAILENEVRGRASRKEVEVSTSSSEAAEDTTAPETIPDNPSKHPRPRAATFASMIIDNAQHFKQGPKPQIGSPTFLISQPARPQTSAATLNIIPANDEMPPVQSQTFHGPVSPKPNLIRNESIFLAAVEQTAGSGPCQSRENEKWLTCGRKSKKLVTFYGDGKER
ncbi:meiosis-specific topoisomerase spo11 protein [Rutstroemia sp. NJR-2017a WRK4]|nr:meiosis-specific topoisomerase spo11 protein [Rutstroemia sp. NJR-2017a WRK4]